MKLNFKVILFVLLLVLLNLSFGKTSIAVVGFANLGSKRENYYNTMITTSIINFLSRFPDLDVVSYSKIKEVTKNIPLKLSNQLNMEGVLNAGLSLGVKQVLAGDYTVNSKKKQIIINFMIFDVVTGELKLKRSYTGTTGMDFFDTVDKINEIVATMFYSKNVKLGKLVLKINSDKEYDFYLNNVYQKVVSKDEGFQGSVLSEIPLYISLKNVGSQKEVYSNTVIVPREEKLEITYVPVGHINIKAEGYENGEVFLNDKMVGNLDEKGVLTLRNQPANMEYEIYLSKEGKKSEKKKFFMEEGRTYNFDFSKGKVFLAEELMAGEVQANLCPDGGFEITEEIKIVSPYNEKNYDRSIAGRWHIVKYDRGFIKPEISNGIAHINFGMYKGMKMGERGDYIWSVSLCIFPIELKAGKYYRITFDAKALKPQDIYIRIGEIKVFSAQPNSEQPLLTPVRIDTEMKKYSYLFKQNFNRKNARLEIYLTGPNEFWFDNIWVEYLGAKVECFGKVEY